MAGLIPFNRKNHNIMSTDFGDFDNMLDDFFAPEWPMRRGFLADTFKLDVRQTDKEYIVEAEMPGTEKKDVSIDYDEGRLNIAVNRSEEKEEKDKDYIHRERSVSSMSRSVYLDRASGEGITAKMDNGVLTINVPKAVRPDTSKNIEIE
jgi:HSP20 family protein